MTSGIWSTGASGSTSASSGGSVSEDRLLRGDGDACGTAGLGGDKGTAVFDEDAVAHTQGWAVEILGEV